MSVSDKAIKEFQEIYKKEHGKDLPWNEAVDGAHRLYGFVKLLYDSAVKDLKRKDKLKEHPKGFHLEGIGYTCFICGDSVSNEESWYDKWGIKCLVCQKAIDRRIIPGSCAKKKESWYSRYDLKSRFGLDRHMVNKFVKHGILKPRIVPNENGSSHVQLFLIKDNKETLPPKKLTEPQMVKEKKEDGKEWHHMEPWYKFAEDPLETLKGYNIANHLKVIFGKKKRSLN